MKNLLSVKEFSKLSGIESSTLRYWDEINLFSPTSRGATNSYRYYSPEQLIAVNFVKVLSSLNVPLKVIKEIGDTRTPESVTDLIKRQEKLLDIKMNKLREHYSVIHTRLEMINYGEKIINGFTPTGGTENGNAAAETISTDKISTIYMDETNLILGPSTNFSGEGFYDPFMQFCKQAKDLHINLVFPIGGIHQSWDEFMKKPGEPHCFFSADPTGRDKRPAGRYVVGFSRGYYGQFGDLPQRMADYIKDNSLTTTGVVYALYLHDEICIKDPSQYLAQVCVAIT